MTDKTDSDLMAYFDGELEGAELEEFEALLEEQESLRDKAAGLGLVRDIVREQVDEDDRADSIADAVMAKLDETSSDELPLQDAPVTAAPANDNSRTIWTLAGVAAAVAAGMFVWGNSAPTTHPSAALVPTQPAAVETPAETAMPAPETLGEMAGTPQLGADEDEDAVEFAQLDYGDDESTGSIHKVDNENTGVHTAVVWVTDLGAEE